MDAKLKKTPLHNIYDWPYRAQQANWCVSTLAKSCGVSVRTLERYFLHTFNQSPKNWLTAHRQKRAAELLHDHTTVKETASLIGYTHPSTFTREFKKQTGQCPSILTKLSTQTCSKARNVA